MSALAAATAGFLTIGSVHAADADRSVFGQMPDGTAVEAITLTNANGVSARVLSYGATLQSLRVPDRSGNLDDVVLGYDDFSDYIEHPQYFGSTVGRFANRIAGAQFVLDGVPYRLAANDGNNALHGGVRGFDKVPWTVGEVLGGDVASVTFSYISPDGEEGYPGTLRASVTYSLDDRNTLTTAYVAVADKPTIVNLTHHSLFNLAGVRSGQSVLGHRLTIEADRYTPVDGSLVPTGELRAVAATPFDFTSARAIGERIRDAGDPQIVIGRGYDHNFVLRGGGSETPKLAARVEDPGSGRVMELFTTEPGLQVYTGNFLNGTIPGKGNVVYRQGDGLALEPQKFPDSPNRPDFPSARLDPGETYRQTSYLRFSVR